MGDSHHAGRVIQGAADRALVAGDIVASAGFGSTATVAIINAGSRDHHARFSVASSGTGQAANPTATLTFVRPFDATPFARASRGDVAAASGDFRVTAISTTSVVVTFVGTPVAGQTYICDLAVDA